MKSFSARLSALEAMEAAEQPALPLYVCMHPRDFAALDDLAMPAELRAAIAEAYQLGGSSQKLYIGVCLCWGGESCRVCDDRPVVSEACV